MEDGHRGHDELHAFASSQDRDTWISEEPRERESGEMWEAGHRAPIDADDARANVDRYDGIAIHGNPKPATIPQWLKDATEGNSMMSGQPRDPREPNVEIYWTNDWR